MNVQRGFLQPAAYRGGYVSIGNFDGVHRGHQRMIASLVSHARADKAPAVVMTFDPHPIEILAPENMPPRLCTLERKIELLADCGVDCLIVYPTDLEFLKRTPEEFFRTIVQGQLAARGLVEGPNFFFGRDRTGTVDRLRNLCAACGMTLDIVEAVVQGGRIVSSSAVRRAIGEGRLAAAVEMLGRPYRLSGRVAPGAGRGRGLGFPTANLTDIRTLLPADGVYAAEVVIDDVPSAAAVHLGSNPTFGETAHKLEVHVLDFAGDLYGRSLHVDLLDRVRGTTTFADAQSLREQLETDLFAVRTLVARHRSRLASGGRQSPDAAS